jgi:DNA-binding CsgD family transcriptional regulator/PAS domain-containing protein
MHHDPLLLDLYSCPAQPARWMQVLDRLCAETGANSAVVQTIRLGGTRPAVQWQASDQRTARQAPRLSVNTENPRLAPHRGLRGLNRVVRDDDLFDHDDPARDALERELATMGLGRFLGTLQPLEGDTYIGVALHRAIDDPCDFNGATVARVAALAPHLRQACQIGSQLRRAEGSLQRLQGHLDGLRCGLLVCDADAQVQWMNRSARQLTADGRELQLHGRTLRARHAGVSHRLQGEIATAGPRRTGFVALGAGADALHLALRAWQPAGEEPTVLIAVTRAGDGATVPAQAWCGLLGVTPAEGALVATLAGGGTLELHAEQRGVSIGTVRGQLKQVLAKTGLHRQADLVRLALGSAAAHLLDSVTGV